MLIGELSIVSGFSRDTIRYYEKLGLIQLKEHDRRGNNYKEYPLSAVDRLTHIRQLKELGFTLTEIAALVDILSNGPDPCADLPRRLENKLTLIDDKVALLLQYKNKLLAVRAACNGSCGNSRGMPDCFGPQ